jgi:cell fate (sporulation/competence/biofilm development) regulator YlbF (YheA/YmcA/DUF963 family)
MDPIIDLAAKLGKAIGQSQQALALRAAREEMHKQPELEKLLQQYQEQAQKIGQMEDENKPIEVEDKRRLQELHDKLVASEVFKKFTSVQVDYVDLMRQVNEALGRELSGTEGE